MSQWLAEIEPREWAALAIILVIVAGVLIGSTGGKGK